MSEEEMNQELSTDELKDFAGGYLTTMETQGAPKISKSKKEETDSILGLANGVRDKKGKPQNNIFVTGTVDGAP